MTSRKLLCWKVPKAEQFQDCEGGCLARMSTLKPLYLTDATCFNSSENFLFGEKRIYFYTCLLWGVAKYMAEEMAKLNSGKPNPF